MYCPQCSQQQLSDEMRFCSRCGFALGGVRELVASTTKVAKPERSAALRGARQATWIILGSAALTLGIGLLSLLEEDLAVLLLLPAFFFLLGFVRLFYAVFVQDRVATAKKDEQAAANLIGRVETLSRHPELPPQRSVSVDSLTRPIRKTAEVIQPPSVTENTTKLLDEEQ